MFTVSRVLDVELHYQIQINLQKLLNDAFEDDFSEEDWQHTFGGTRFLGNRDGELIAHGAVVPRKMKVDGESVMVGYVEAVAVLPSCWGNGFGTFLMAEITSYCRSEFPLSMLSTDQKNFYRRHGWSDFEGKSFVSKDGLQYRTEDEDEGLMFLCDSDQGEFSPRLVICRARDGDAW